MLLYCTKISRPYHRFLVLLREALRQLDLDIYLADHSFLRVSLRPLNQLDPLRGDTSLLAKGQHIDSSTGPDGPQKKIERRRSGSITSSQLRLIRPDRESFVESMHPLPAGENDFHIHFCWPLFFPRQKPQIGFRLEDKSGHSLPPESRRSKYLLFPILTTHGTESLAGERSCSMVSGRYSSPFRI